MPRWPHSVVALLDALGLAAQSPERAGQWERELAAEAPRFPPPLTVLEGSTRWQEPSGPAFASTLGLTVEADLPAAWGHVRRVLLGDGLVALTTVAQHAPAGDLIIWAADTAALERVLAAASSTGMRLLFETAELPLVDALAPPPSTAHAHRGDYGSIEIAIEPSAVSQRLSLLGLPVELARFESHSRRRQLPHARGSVRVERWARRARVVRTGRRFDDAQVGAYLAEHGIARHRAGAVAFERALGGLLAPASYDPTSRRPSIALGLGLVAAAPAALSAAWLEWPEDRDDDDPDLVPGARPLGQGVWCWGGTQLVLAGEHDDHFVFCDDSGRIWSWTSVTQAMEVAAERGEVFLERLAIDDELWHERRPCASSPLHIFGTVGQALASALALAPVPEASDAVVQHWASDEIWVRQLADCGANAAETRFYTESSARAVEAAHAARSAAPGVPIRLWSNEPVGVTHRNALASAGIDDLQTLLDRSVSAQPALRGSI